jgi:hypothetical protein
LSGQPNYDIWVAIVALVSSVASAVISAIFTRKNEVRVKHLENKLAIERAAEDARRDYEYEARKRLYQECEPILFQFAEFSESALRRIYALARNARDGNLGPERYWLSTDHYFMRSTIYRLLAPMAAFKLLRHRLTSIDLKLDQSINIQYGLAKILYYTFSSSQDLARSEPAIPYDPQQIDPQLKDVSESERKANRTRYPQKYWLQGLKVGTLDILAERLISINNGKNPRVKSFGEFEQEFFREPSGHSSSTLAENNSFEIFFTLFSYFHPGTRPVLWRVLITQAYLYNAIINIRSNNGNSIKTNILSHENYDRFRSLFEIEYIKSECNWKQPAEELTDEDFNVPFKAVEYYLKKQISNVSKVR